MLIDSAVLDALLRRYKTNLVATSSTGTHQDDLSAGPCDLSVTGQSFRRGADTHDVCGDADPHLRQP